MPHNTESARATVLEPKRPEDATPMRDPVNHVHIVGALIWRPRPFRHGGHRNRRELGLAPDGCSALAAAGCN
jgi:hypothetical protein